MTLVIMAAGMGSRYGGIKQIDPMGPNGEIILDYSVYDAIKAGFERVVFIIRHDIEDVFRQSVGNRFKGKITVDYAFQELCDVPDGFTMPRNRTKPWGTCHAVLACKNIVTEPFVVINADDFYGAAAFHEGVKGIKLLNANPLEGFLVGYRLDNTLSPHGSVSRGVCESDGRYLTKVTERLKIWRNDNGAVEYQDYDKTFSLSGKELVSMNFWGFSPMIFDILEREFSTFLTAYGSEMKSEYVIPTEVNHLISTGQMKIRVLKSDSVWFGVTYREDKPAVRRSLVNLINQGHYPTPLWSSSLSEEKRTYPHP